MAIVWRLHGRMRVARAISYYRHIIYDRVVLMKNYTKEEAQTLLLTAERELHSLEQDIPIDSRSLDVSYGAVCKKAWGIITEYRVYSWLAEDAEI